MPPLTDIFYQGLTPAVAKLTMKANFSRTSDNKGLLARRKLSTLALDGVSKMSSQDSFKSSMSSSSTNTLELNAMYAKYIVLEHLGSGCQGSVFKIKQKLESNNESLVVKILNANEDAQLEMARSEIDLLQRLKGQIHLAQFVESFEDENAQKIYIVMRHAGNLSLAKLMKTFTAGLPPAIARNLTE